MSQLRLYVLGSPRLERQGQPIEARPRKALALLIYLAVTRQPHSRDALATLFWPEFDQASARASLRRTLHRLHESLSEGILAASLDTVSLDAQRDLWLDADQYQRLVAEYMPATHPNPDLGGDSLSRLIEAVNLYTGDFLAGFNLADCPQFDEWQFFQREELRQSLADVFEQIICTYQARQEYDAAIPFARRWLALDPLHEPVHRQLMTLYAMAGQQAAALRQYQECERILSVELDVPPEPETVQLYEAIKRKQVAPPAAMPQTKVTPPAVETLVRPAPGVTAPPHHLPPQTTLFVGRETELQQIARLLLEEPACRLLTIVGQGGTGKTRLALQVAQQIVELAPEKTIFDDGVFFVPLSPVTTADGIVSAIAESLDLSFYSQASIRKQLLDNLQPKRMLLVLDKFEHLLSHEDLLADILAVAPGVKILLTSRVGTTLQEDWFYPIFGLSFPVTAGAVPGSASSYEAVQLFEHCARRVQPSFSLAAAQEHVVRICRLVEGMPLAIELAAAWLKALPAKAVADELEQSLDILTARYQNMPERHRSMRAVLEQSWTLLANAEQDALRRLSVFRGGFSHDAAQAVAGASRLTLASLMEKSLLRHDETGRYHIHELLRQFAGEQLQTEPGQYDRVRDQYCAYYTDFLQLQKVDLQGARQKEALDRIAAELDNIRTAWQWAVERGDHEKLAKAAQTFWLFCHYRGALHEGEAAFGGAVRSLVKFQPGASRGASRGAWSSAEDEALGIILAGYGWIQARRGDTENGRALMEQGVERLQRAGNKDQEMFACIYLGAVAQFQERYREAREIGQQSASYFASVGNQWGVATCYELMGSSDLGSGRFDQAERLLQESLDICRKMGERRVRFLDAINLSIIATELGEYERAKHLLDESEESCRELHDRLGMMFTLQCMGRLAMEQGEYAQAIEHAQASRAISAEIGAIGLVEVLDYLGSTLRLQGNYQAAQEVLERSLHEAKARGLQRRMAHCLCNLGCIAYEQRDYSQAEQLQREALIKIRAFGNEPEIAWMLCQLGHTAVALGEGAGGRTANWAEPAGMQEAREYYRQAIQLATTNRLAPVALETLTGVARLLRQVGQPQEAAELLSLVESHRATSYHARAKARTSLAELAHELSPTALEGARSRGRALDWLAAANQIFDRLSGSLRSELAPVFNNLPVQSTPFIGREQELANSLRHIQDPNCRLLAVVGPGGIGKTRLAIQAAQLLVEAQYGGGRFADGIAFISLSAVTTPSGLAPAIAAAIGLDLQGNVQPSRHLLTYLRDKRMLLVLDNCEHLFDATGLITEILAAAPFVKVLATSREGLSLQGSWIYPIAGMSYPRQSTRHSMPVESYEAVQLFVQSARRVRPDFDLQQEEQHVIRICQLVEGIPLALELAATWLRVLSVENVAGEIERGLDFLVSLHRDAPERHRSMRAVLEYSWQLLSDEEREVLARLSVFRGGFRRRAADQVANAPLLTLALLVDKSLVQVDAEGRYRLHNLLRQFAAEKLHELPQEEKATRDRHADYYLDFLSAREQRLKRKEMPVALAEIASELDNITLAWDWALAQEDLDAIERSCNSLWRFYSVRGRSQELAAILLEAISRLQQSPTARSHPKYDAAMRVLLIQEALCEYYLSNFAVSAARLEESLVLARKLGDTVAIADTLVIMGAIATRQGDQQRAESHLLQSLAFFRDTGYADGVADTMHELAHLYSLAGDYEKARHAAHESLVVSRQLGRLDWIGYALDVLGWVAFSVGDYKSARRYYEESLAQFQEVDHQLGIALAVGGLGIVAWAEGKNGLEEALARLEESLAVCRRIGDRLHIASRLVHLAQATNDVPNHRQAWRYAEEGIAIATEIGAADFTAHLHCCLAEAAYGMGDFETARSHLSQAMALGVQCGLRPRLALALYHWAVLLLKESEQAASGASGGTGPLRQAAEILTLIAREPANWLVFRERSQRLLAQLQPQLPPQVVAQIDADLANRSLEDVAGELLVWPVVNTSVTG